jgi:hypothetical protein
MKQFIGRLTRRYALALSSHLKRSPDDGMRPALALGRRAVARGLDTLEMARVHQGALARLEIADQDDATLARAERFFAAANIPMVESHHASRASRAALRRSDERLKSCTLKLAVANRLLKDGVERRRSIGIQLKKSGEKYAALVRESQQLQDKLRKLLHHLMNAQEDEKKELSRKLQDEVSQILLAINIRLLELKQRGWNATGRFTKKVANTRLQADRSVKAVGKLLRPRDKP